MFTNYYLCPRCESRWISEDDARPDDDCSCGCRHVTPLASCDELKVVSTSTCETRYEYGQHWIRLWMIVGGTPALAFQDYGASRRYPVVERWDTEHWEKTVQRYHHQDPQNIVGPMATEVLPEGEATLKAWFMETVFGHELGMRRWRQIYEALGCGNEISRRVHNREQRCYYRMEIHLRDTMWLPYTEVTSAEYVACRPDAEQLRELPPVWRHAFTQIRELGQRYSYLSEPSTAEFNELKGALECLTKKKSRAG